MDGSPIDWPALGPDVCRALLGEPTSATRRELRWGRKGSLVLYLDTGRLYNFEADASLGLLDLVEQHNRLANRAAALQWLRDQGFLPPLSGSPGPPPKPGPGPRPRTNTKTGPKGPFVPFWQSDLPKLDYTAIPDDPDHPLNRWANFKCARPPGAAWPNGCRWLRGWRDGHPAWGGDALLVPLARPEAWLPDGDVRRTSVQGIHAVFIAPDGHPRRLPDGRNKTDWSNTRRHEERVGTTAACGFLAGTPQPEGRLALCEGAADALAIHWHLGVPALAACGSLDGLAGAVEEFVWASSWPLQLRLELWFDQDARPSARTGLRAGPAGGIALWQALVRAGVPDAQVTILEYGRPGQDPCDYLAGRQRPNQ